MNLLLFLQQLQRGGEITVGLIKCLHSVEHLVLGFTVELLSQIVELCCVVNIVIEHILQNSHGLGAHIAALGMQMCMIVVMIVMMVVGMTVMMMVVVMMAHKLTPPAGKHNFKHIHYTVIFLILQGIEEDLLTKIFANVCTRGRKLAKKGQ